jgi:hypothetical protein
VALAFLAIELANGILARERGLTQSLSPRHYDRAMDERAGDRELHDRRQQIFLDRVEHFGS